ncbi:hypothetical protein [Fusobacterium varium]|uniref:hypothetical protein n=1 Tax=Fusobacterium varium TaxID=856 RepID=UPI0035698B02
MGILILGIILLIVGIISFGGVVGFFILIVGIILILVACSREKEKEIAKEKEICIAKRTKELMGIKNLSILEAKAQVEMEYIFKHNNKNSKAKMKKKEK